MHTPPSRQLSGAGQHATIAPDDFTDGAFVLRIGAAEQSHVDLADPTHLFYEYLRRIGNLVDVVASPGQPIRALHLGAGALTLARYIAVTRPGSVQTAVELERELLDFILAHLPLPEGTNLNIRHGDARDVVAELAAELAAKFAAETVGPDPDATGRGPRFDVIVLDIFAGDDAPQHLRTPQFYAEMTALLAPGGIVVVNVGDDPPLAFAREQIRVLAGAVLGAAVLTEQDMLTGRYPGNLILAGLRRPWPPNWTAALLAAGPHPAAVLTGVELEAFARR